MHKMFMIKTLGSFNNQKSIGEIANAFEVL